MRSTNAQASSRCRERADPAFQNAAGARRRCVRRARAETAEVQVIDDHVAHDGAEQAAGGTEDERVGEPQRRGARHPAEASRTAHLMDRTKQERRNHDADPRGKETAEKELLPYPAGERHHDDGSVTRPGDDRTQLAFERARPLHARTESACRQKRQRGDREAEDERRDVGLDAARGEPRRALERSAAEGEGDRERDGDEHGVGERAPDRSGEARALRLAVETAPCPGSFGKKRRPRHASVTARREAPGNALNSRHRHGESVSRDFARLGLYTSPSG
ncbi:hypothetical protein BH09MYX1_BH09MYX1_39580 [soil metagenome]